MTTASYGMVFFHEGKNSIGRIIIPTAKYYDKSSVGIPSTKLDYHGKFVFRPTKPFKCSFTLESP